MAKRLLDCGASDYAKMSKEELLWAIGASEGRVLACETIGIFTPLLNDITNAELVSALGADILLLNIFDVDNPQIQGLPPVAPEDTVRELKRLTGRPVGINLEPVEEDYAKAVDTMWTMTPGRLATPENARKAADMGVDFILLTGNPGTGVTNKAITDSLRLFREAVGDRVILAAGKMHTSGVIGEGGEHIITPADVEAFAQAGADILLFPAPGTVPELTVEYIRSLVGKAHSLGKLTMTSIGTSQEGADTDTIRRIALMCKMAGADIHHLGDSGYTGIAAPENVTAYSIVIKGVRHTYRRMARSLNR
ncbi:MAG: haloacid dehalogenase-like hydrolase [Oscillospiraceae bacterium]|nr:haloacid dehalogenase-like hydrolase [Oscillospiraceae bacterium]